MRKKNLVSIACACICCSTLFLPLAFAQDTALPLSLEDKRTYFRQGTELFEKKEYEQACQLFLLLDGRYPELQDYVSYFLAVSLQQQGENRDALTRLQQFLSRFPSHPLQNDVRFLVADTLLAMHKYAEALRLYQQFSESPSEGKAELLYKLGVTLAHTKNTQDAVSALHTLITGYPGYKNVTAAQRVLQELLKTWPELTPAWTENSLLDYADALLNARLYSAAITQYSSFQTQYPASERIADSELGMAEAYFRSGQATRGTKTLEEMVTRYTASQPNIAAKALYRIGTKHWYADRNRGARRVMQRIVTEFRETDWSDNAYYVLGRIYQSNRDYLAAAQWYTSLNRYYPESSFAEEALWRAAWSYYLAQHFPKAVEQFSHVITTFPTGVYCDDSLYWKGRSLEKQANLNAALTTYRQLIATSSGSYYGIRAQHRLPALQSPAASTQSSSLRHPGFAALLREFSHELPAQLFQNIIAHVEKSCELHEVQHDAFARKEVEWIKTLLDQHFAKNPDVESQALSLYVLGRIYGHVGLHLPAIQLAPKITHLLTPATAQAFPYDIERLSYPLSYDDLILKYADLHQLDPFLVAGIIRQESAYNPKARSSANARGLMQILPKTGRLVAKQIGLTRFRAAELYDPETSIAIGTAYLAELLDLFNGDLFRAVAGYNAGPKATNKWWPTEGRVDSEEIVEDITYRETRNYVKRVLRNQSNYQRIYAETLREHKSAP